jgi:hypothetical protein
MSKGTKVQALRPHSFAGVEYQVGDTYTVHGDAHQTVEQYLDSLHGAGLAKVHGDESGPNIVDEIGSPEATAPHKSTAVEPLSTENIQQPEPAAQPAKGKKAKAAKSAAKKAKAKK